VEVDYNKCCWLAGVFSPDRLSVSQRRDGRMTGMQTAVEAFLDHLVQIQGASVHTVAAYRGDLGQFLGCLAAQEVLSWKQVTQEHVADFIRWLQGKGYALSTVARKFAAARSLFCFLVERGILEDDPSAGVTCPRVSRRPRRLLSAKDITRLLDAPRSGGSPRVMRDRALLALLYTTGMRVSEVIGLQVCDLDMERGQVRCGKDEARVRVLPLTPPATASLRVYLEQGRPRLVQDEGVGALFVNHRGEPLTRQGLWLIVKKRAEEAGLGRDVTPHTLRHSCAVHALEHGVPLEEVRERLGHANLSTTRVYARVAGVGRGRRLRPSDTDE